EGVEDRVLGVSVLGENDEAFVVPVPVGAAAFLDQLQQALRLCVGFLGCSLGPAFESVEQITLFVGEAGKPAGCGVVGVGLGVLELVVGLEATLDFHSTLTQERERQGASRLVRRVALERCPVLSQCSSEGCWR